MPCADFYRRIFTLPDVGAAEAFVLVNRLIRDIPIHIGDGDFADLANLGFAKICEYLGLKSFLKRKERLPNPQLDYRSVVRD